MCVCWPGGSHPTDRGPQTTKCCQSHGKSLLSYQWWSRGEGASPRVIGEDGGPPLQLLSGTGSLHPPPRSFPISLALSPGSSSREAVMLRLWSRLPSRNGEKTKICPRVFPPFLQNLNFLFFFLNFGISSRFWAKIQVIFVLPETWLPVPWSNSSLLAPAAIWHSQRME